MIEVKINDSEVKAALQRLSASMGNLKPVMQDIGEYLLLSTKKRFKDGISPDGKPWAANKPSTILEYLRRKGGDTSRRPGEESNNPYFSKKDGRLNKRGASLVIGKRPLIGESKRLSNEITVQATSSRVTVGSSLIQSAVQQFGAKRGSFGTTKRGRPLPWGDIPARPFLGLSDKDLVNVVDIVGEYLQKISR